jgi:hypothetical protein
MHLAAPSSHSQSACLAPLRLSQKSKDSEAARLNSMEEVNDTQPEILTGNHSYFTDRFCDHFAASKSFDEDDL